MVHISMFFGWVTFQTGSYEVRRELPALGSLIPCIKLISGFLERAGSGECVRTQRVGGIQPSLIRGEGRRDYD